MPGIGAAAKKILVEWIDLGAQWESTARLRKEGGEREKE
jgi:hypothetical protein